MRWFHWKIIRCEVGCLRNFLECLHVSPGKETFQNICSNTLIQSGQMLRVKKTGLASAHPLLSFVIVISRLRSCLTCLPDMPADYLWFGVFVWIMNNASAWYIKALSHPRPTGSIDTTWYNKHRETCCINNLLGDQKQLCGDQHQQNHHGMEPHGI